MSLRHRTAEKAQAEIGDLLEKAWELAAQHCLGWQAPEHADRTASFRRLIATIEEARTANWNVARAIDGMDPLATPEIRTGFPTADELECSGRSRHSSVHRMNIELDRSRAIGITNQDALVAAARKVRAAVLRRLYDAVCNSPAWNTGVLQGIDQIEDINIDLAKGTPAELRLQISEAIS